MAQKTDLNPHTIGLVMKECVRRSILEIRRQRATFTSEVKISDYKSEEDLVTSADRAAQEIYIKVLDENFPLAGIVAEENFSRPCTDTGDTYYFTVDPLDGTKAYGRKQSHAVMSMLSFVHNDEVTGICIGDPNTLEVFHSRPGSDKVHRIFEFENSQQLTINSKQSLGVQYLQLRDSPFGFSELGQRISGRDLPHDHRLFKNFEVNGGSIGFTFARLWKGEVGGVLIGKGNSQQMPWDICPVLGMSKKMGFLFYLIVNDRLDEYTFMPKEEPIILNHELLCVHESRKGELMSWVSSIN